MFAAVTVALALVAQPPARPAAPPDRYTTLRGLDARLRLMEERLLDRDIATLTRAADQLQKEIDAAGPADPEDRLQKVRFLRQELQSLARRLRELEAPGGQLIPPAAPLAEPVEGSVPPPVSPPVAPPPAVPRPPAPGGSR